jgi:ATP-binding cassette subfamily B protein
MIASRVVNAFLPVATLYIGKLLIDEVVRLIALSPRPVGFDAWRASGALDTIVWLLALECAFAIGSDLLRRISGYFDQLLNVRVGLVTGVQLMEHAGRLDLAQFEDSELQDKLSRARQQTTSGVNVLAQVFGWVQELLTLVSFAAGVVLFAPWLVVVLLIAILPAFVGESYFNAKEYELRWKRAEDFRFVEYLKNIGSQAETAKETKIFGLIPYLIERFRRTTLEFIAVVGAFQRRKLRWMALLTGVGTLGYYSGYAWLAWRTIDGQFTVGDLTFLAGSFRRLSQSIGGLLIGFGSAASAALYLDDFFSFFRIAPRITSPPHPRPFPSPIARGIVFEGVGMRYPGADRWAVRDLSFTVRARESLALVGENGAGKTTLVKLLARLYDPDEGRILVDGVDLREFALDDLRSNIGVIFQDFVRYAFTARENIGIARVDAMNDQPRIEDAARRGLADTVIARLERGWDQPLGLRFFAGIDLSGGEWQKIAMARAFMRRAQLLILDEPTAALDARAEYEVFRRFRELSHGTTCVLISHRFSSVRMADRILMLNDGRLDALGTHAELLAQRGRYAELFELQAEGYR